MSSFKEKFMRRIAKMFEGNPKPKPKREEPVAENVEEPAGEPVEKPVMKPIEKPIEMPVQEAVQESQEEMIEEMMEELAQEPLSSMAIGFPLYIYPSEGTWAPLFTAVENNPATTFNLIVNPNNGPGGPVPDSNYVECLSRLNSYGNVQLFGYIYTTWGKRDLADIQADISTYETWAQYEEADIHVDGIFLDEAPSDIMFAHYMSKITAAARATMTRKSLVWSNPGVPVHRALYEAVDMVNACENSHQFWSRDGGNKGIPHDLRDKTTIMIHSYEGTKSDLHAEREALKAAGYHSTFITMDQTYTTFCPMWEHFAHDILHLKGEPQEYL